MSTSTRGHPGGYPMTQPSRIGGPLRDWSAPHSTSRSAISSTCPAMRGGSVRHSVDLPEGYPPRGPPRGLAPATVHQVHRTLRTALNEAVRRSRITSNPAQIAKSPRSVVVAVIFASLGVKCDGVRWQAPGTDRVQTASPHDTQRRPTSPGVPPGQRRADRKRPGQRSPSDATSPSAICTATCRRDQRSTDSARRRSPGPIAV